MAESEMYALSVLEEWMTISPPLRQVLAENLGSPDFHVDSFLAGL